MTGPLAQSSDATIVGVFFLVCFAALLWVLFWWGPRQ